MAEDASAVNLGFRTWGYLAPALPQCAIAMAMVAAVIADPSTWWAWGLLGSSGGLVVVRLLNLRHAHRTHWIITINSEGVRWNDRNYQLRWSQVAEIRVVKAHGWRRLLPHIDRLALIPPAQADFARRAGAGPIGAPIILSRVDATPQFIIDSLRRFTDAPVTP